ncbi:hypothetical protein C2845_PM02G45970 [Panicum miliaceum]|uniref:Secreted protein n=1 Tax=Panicum miliaceum TaxID=4540 RepID=A0A3L6S9R0_PANMI|nr:hypothetical protein C2845_PM02G45970 [Panicum miliaceum]
MVSGSPLVLLSFVYARATSGRGAPDAHGVRSQRRRGVGVVLRGGGFRFGASEEEELIVHPVCVTLPWIRFDHARSRPPRLVVRVHRCCFSPEAERARHLHEHVSACDSSPAVSVFILLAVSSGEGEMITPPSKGR